MVSDDFLDLIGRIFENFFQLNHLNLWDIIKVFDTCAFPLFCLEFNLILLLFLRCRGTIGERSFKFVFWGLRVLEL